MILILPALVLGILWPLGMLEGSFAPCCCLGIKSVGGLDLKGSTWSGNLISRPFNCTLMHIQRARTKTSSPFPLQLSLPGPHSSPPRLRPERRLGAGLSPPRSAPNSWSSDERSVPRAFWSAWAEISSQSFAEGLLGARGNTSPFPSAMQGGYLLPEGDAYCETAL